MIEKYEFKLEKLLNLKTFLSKSKSVICFSLDFEGNVLYCNEGYKRILEYSENNIKDKLINPLLESLIIEADDMLVFSGIITLKKIHLNSSFISQIYKFSDELFFLCEYDGLEIETFFKEMSLNTLSINNMNRELVKKGIMLKNAISKQKETQTMLIQSEKMRAEELQIKNTELKKISNEKSKILGIVAHDLRSPIGGIFSLSKYISSAVETVSSQDPIRFSQLKESIEFLEVITDSSKYLLELINDILDVSAIETGDLALNFEFIKYIPFLNKAIRIDKETAKNKNITIMSLLEIEPNIMICMDKIKISQVINNFLQNAIKFSHPLGKIILKVYDDGDYITTKVIDEGDGIQKLERDKLFKIFSTTSSTPTGGEKSNGLGLYISQKIIDAHNGIIGFEENENTGSIFYFKLNKNHK